MTIFVNNETLVFGYSKFKLIDTGVKYINPKHFSVKNFVSIADSIKSEITVK